jgi:hypothetical protein
LLRIEPDEVTVRTPEQPSNVDAPATRIRQKGGNRFSAARYHFVSVTAPISEAYLVVALEVRDGFSQASEIRDPINKEVHVVTFGPRRSAGIMRVNRGQRVTPFFRGKEPVVEVHHESTYFQCRDHQLNRRECRPSPFIIDQMEVYESDRVANRWFITPSERYVSNSTLRAS